MQSKNGEYLVENKWTMEHRERKWKVNEEWKWQHLGNGVSPGTRLWPCPSLPNILGRISAQKFGGEQFPVPRLPILARFQKLASHPNERVQRGSQGILIHSILGCLGALVTNPHGPVLNGVNLLEPSKFLEKSSTGEHQWDKLLDRYRNSQQK